MQAADTLAKFVPGPETALSSTNQQQSGGEA
jgi:hypothetical protein